MTPENVKLMVPKIISDREILRAIELYPQPKIDRDFAEELFAHAIKGILPALDIILTWTLVKQHTYIFMALKAVRAILAAIWKKLKIESYTFGKT